MLLLCSNPAVNKPKGNQYNDYPRKYSRDLLDFPGLTKAVTYDERSKMKRDARLKAVISLSLHVTALPVYFSRKL